MITETIILTVLKAAEGMVLTNGKAFSSVGGSVYLGVSDSPDNWSEITAEEYEKTQEELRKLHEDVSPEEDLIEMEENVRIEEVPENA